MTVLRLGAALVLCAWLVSPAAAAEPTGQQTGAAVDARTDRVVVVVKDGRVSIRADDVSLRAVLAAVAREAGMTLIVRGSEDRRVTVRFEDVELADAIERVARADFVVGGDRLIVFLTPPRPRSATMSAHGIPAARVPEVRALDTPHTPPQRPPSASASSRRRARRTVGNSGAVATIDVTGAGTPAATFTSSAPDATRAGMSPTASTNGAGAATLTAAPTSSGPGSAMVGALDVAQPIGGRIAGESPPIAPQRPVGASYVLDPAEARRLATEVDARASEPSAVDTSDSTASEAALRRSLP